MPAFSERFSVLSFQAVGFMRKFFSFLIMLGVMELLLLILLGKWIGIGWTLFLLVLSGLIGIYLTKREGLFTIEKARRQLSYGQIPGEEIMDGLFILLGAFLLLLPGLITDLLGLYLLWPVTRRTVKPFFIRGIKRRLSGRTFVYTRRYWH
jgi:UPF0716 protein FxsA